MRWNDQLKGGKADYLRPQDFPKKALLTGMRHELEHTKSHRLAMEIAMDHLAEDPEYYEKLRKIERHQNPSTSRRQQRFMCAEYGRKRRGQRTKTGMSRGQLKEFCQRRVKNPADWAMIGQGIVYEMSKHNLSMEKAYEVAKRKLMADPEVYQLATNIRLGVEHMRRKKNPHLTSGKWRFVGMFEKRDIPSVRRILKIHGMKNKVTKDQLKREPGMRELYVERGGYDTAYRAITRLFEGRRAA